MFELKCRNLNFKFLISLFLQENLSLPTVLNICKVIYIFDLSAKFNYPLIRFIKTCLDVSFLLCNDKNGPTNILLHPMVVIFSCLRFLWCFLSTTFVGSERNALPIPVFEVDENYLKSWTEKNIIFKVCANKVYIWK